MSLRTLSPLPGAISDSVTMPLRQLPGRYVPPPSDLPPSMSMTCPVTNPARGETR